LKIAVLVPTYFGSQTLKKTLDSLKSQTCSNFKVYISDDSGANAGFELEFLRSVVNGYLGDFEMDVQFNPTNIGYPKNLIKLVESSTEELFFLLAQDDVLSCVAIESCVKALEHFPESNAVSRPYYWFDRSLEKPIRQIPNMGSTFPELVTSKSEWWKVERTLVAASQLTGLMYRRSGIREPFVNSIFPAHIYPLAGALRDGGVVYLPYPTVAVSVEHSQTRTLSSIYTESPARAWISLYRKVFAGDEYTAVRVNGIKKHMGMNFVGLIQIRSFGKYRYFLRELGVMLNARPKNTIDLRFIFTAVGLAVLPRRIIIFIVSNFKSRVISRTLSKVRLATKEDAWWM